MREHNKRENTDITELLKSDNLLDNLFYERLNRENLDTIKLPDELTDYHSMIAQWVHHNWDNKQKLHELGTRYSITELAVISDAIDVLDKLKQSSPDQINDEINKNLNHALALALELSEYKTIEWLVNNGANIANCQCNRRYTTTPVHLAVHRENIELLRMIKEKSPAYFHEAVNSSNELGDLPLWESLICDNHELMRWLLNNGASIYQINNNGENILHGASRFDDINIALDALYELEPAAIITAAEMENCNGETPIVIAMLSKNSYTARWLLNNELFTASKKEILKVSRFYESVFVILKNQEDLSSDDKLLFNAHFKILILYLTSIEPMLAEMAKRDIPIFFQCCREMARAYYFFTPDSMSTTTKAQHDYHTLELPTFTKARIISHLGGEFFPQNVLAQFIYMNTDFDWEQYCSVVGRNTFQIDADIKMRRQRYYPTIQSIGELLGREDILDLLCTVDHDHYVKMIKNWLDNNYENKMNWSVINNNLEFTIVHLATMCGAIDILEKIKYENVEYLKANLNVSRLGTDMSISSPVTIRPLYLATCLGEANTVRWLLENGAKLNWSLHDHLNSFIHIAVEKRAFNVLKVFENYAKDYFKFMTKVELPGGGTPLALAADFNNDLLPNDNMIAWMIVKKYIGGTQNEILSLAEYFKARLKIVNENTALSSIPHEGERYIELVKQYVTQIEPTLSKMGENDIPAVFKPYRRQEMTSSANVQIDSKKLADPSAMSKFPQPSANDDGSHEPPLPSTP